MNAVEQRDCILGLVRLQLADEVQLDVRVSLAKDWPLGLCLLHAVFAEQALPGSEQRLDRGGLVRLGYGNEFDHFGLASRNAGGLGDAGADVL